MKNKIFNIIKIVLSATTFPLWFIKMFVGIGHLPNQEGEIIEVIFRHSMYENICDGIHPIIAYTAMAAISVSIVLNILNLKSSNARLQTISNVVFGAATVIFIILLLYASGVGRGY